MLEQILAQAQQLSPIDRVRLIQRIAETLLPPDRTLSPRMMVYGQFRGDPARMSTEEDFKLAEWRPTEEALNGP